MTDEELQEKGITPIKKTMGDLKGWRLIKTLYTPYYNGVYGFSLNKVVWLKDMELALIVRDGETMIMADTMIDEDLLDMILENIKSYVSEKPIKLSHYNSYAYNDESITDSIIDSKLSVHNYKNWNPKIC